MTDEKEQLESTEEELTSEELEDKQTDEVDEKDDKGVEEPETPKTPPSDEKPELMSAMKKYAGEYGFENQDFVKLDDPDAFAKRTMQQMKGYRDQAQRLEEATQGVPSTLAPPLAPQDVPQVVPTAEDGVVDDLLGDPVGFLNKQMAQRDAKQQEQAHKIAMFQEDQKINQWASTLPQDEVGRLAPMVYNDPALRFKRVSGQVITLEDSQAAYQNARLNSANMQQVRQDGIEEGAAATDAKRRAAVESGKKKSGTSVVSSLDDLQRRLNAGEELTDAEINAAIAAEEAAG